MNTWRMEVEEVSKLDDNRVMVSGKLLEGERPQQGDHYQVGSFTGVVSDATSLGGVLGFMGAPTAVYGSGSSLSTSVSFVSGKIDLLRVTPGMIASGGSGQGAKMAPSPQIQRYDSGSNAIGKQNEGYIQNVAAERNKPHFNICTIGHVGHGKTTLTDAIIMRLAHKGFVTVKRCGEYVEYETEHHCYTHVDFSGCPDSIQNLSTGAAQMDRAILVVSADDGPMQQTRDHVIMARQARASVIVVYINKMDLQNDPEMQELLELDVCELLTAHGFPGDAIPIIRGSARAAMISEGKDDRACESIDALISVIDGKKIPKGQNEIPKGQSGCFIATACYGAGNCSEIDELRRFRDEVLLRSAFGHAIVAIYYTVSPAIAEWLKARPKTAAFVRRGILDKIVSGLRRKNRQMPKKQGTDEGK